MIGPSIPEHLLKGKKNDSEISVELSDDEDQGIGPQIPKHLLEKKQSTNFQPNTPHNSDEIAISDEEDIGPQIPSYLLKKSTNDIGPQIPKHLLEKKVSIGPQIPQANNSDEIQISDEEDNIGPQIPRHLLEKNANNIGPQIPQNFLNRSVGPQMSKSSSNSDEISTSDEDTIGPNIPSSFREQQPSIQAQPVEETEDPDAYAPALPPDLLQERQKQPVGRRRRPVGPTMPTGFIPQPEEEEDDVIGPSLPSDYNPEVDAKYSAIRDIEERARQTKEAIEEKKNETKKTKRAEWMMLPPEVDYLKHANSNKSRKFSNNTLSKEDRDSSGWTDTPADRERKMKEGKRKADEDLTYSALEAERRRNIQEYNMQTRPLSLLEMHQQQSKKKKKEGSESAINRPFDREKDLLGTKPMGKKQKDELMRQTAELGKNFGYGRSSFL